MRTQFFPIILSRLCVGGQNNRQEIFMARENDPSGEVATKITRIAKKASDIVTESKERFPASVPVDFFSEIPRRVLGVTKQNGFKSGKMRGQPYPRPESARLEICGKIFLIRSLQTNRWGILHHWHHFHP
jgi:hypothetical protein